MAAAVEQPVTPEAAVDRLLLYCHKHAYAWDSIVQVYPEHDLTLTAARTPAELDGQLMNAAKARLLHAELDQMSQRGRLPGAYQLPVSITPVGWQRATDLVDPVSVGRRVFVALSPRDAEAEVIWRCAVLPAVDALDLLLGSGSGYVDRYDHNAILASYSSSIVICDFSSATPEIFKLGATAICNNAYKIHSCRRAHAARIGERWPRPMYLWDEPEELRDHILMEVRRWQRDHAGASGAQHAAYRMPERARWIRPPQGHTPGGAG